MADPLRDREYITLSAHPLTPRTDQSWQDFVRVLEGHLQRIEGRVEALQDAVVALGTRVKALE
jgi:hypothetical protein